MIGVVQDMYLPFGDQEHRDQCLLAIDENVRSLERIDYSQAKLDSEPTHMREEWSFSD